MAGAARFLAAKAGRGENNGAAAATTPHVCTHSLRDIASRAVGEVQVGAGRKPITAGRARAKKSEMRTSMAKALLSCKKTAEEEEEEEEEEESFHPTRSFSCSYPPIDTHYTNLPQLTSTFFHHDSVTSNLHICQLRLDHVSQTCRSTGLPPIVDTIRTRVRAHAPSVRYSLLRVSCAPRGTGWS